MPTRTINLKMVLNRSDEGLELRQALWTTHEEMNIAVRKIEEFLLLCRGKAYWTIDEKGDELEIKEEILHQQLLEKARETQKKNKTSVVCSDEEILSLFYQLYEKLVPTVNEGKKGDAQKSNALVSPLMDPKSDGGLSVYEKIIEPIPEWIQMKNDIRKGWEEESINWLESINAKNLMECTGRPSSWVDKVRKKIPWQDAFIEDQEKKKEEIKSGNAPLIKELKEKGLIPIIEPYIKSKFNNEKDGVTPWDRMAMRLAVAHLLSWESWNHETKKEYEKILKRKNELSNKLINCNNELIQFRKYESQRHQELKRIAEATDENPYRVRKRALRGWKKIRENWLDAKEDTVESRKTILRNLQEKLEGAFGDPYLFNWLAEDININLWTDKNILPELIKLNELELLLKRKKGHAQMTFADARLHPRWSCFEAPGGSNIKNYELTAANNGKIEIKIPLLTGRENNGLCEKQFAISIAPSGQFQKVELKGNKKDKNLKFHYISSNQDFSGTPGGSEIFFDRLYMCNREIEILRHGNIGSVWFKFTIDVDHKPEYPEWIKNGRTQTPPEVHHFSTALINKSKHVHNITAGLRVLSVDMGMRTFASCSVFELVDTQPERGLFFETDQEGLWAQHERSFLLRLPGEKASRKIEEKRSQAMEEIYSLKRDIKRLRDILRLSVETCSAKRTETLSEMHNSIESENKTTVLKAILSKLNEMETQINHNNESWKRACDSLFEEAEKEVSKRFSKWRRHTRPRPIDWNDWNNRRGYNGGKSIWMIEYLDAVRKLLISWSMRGRGYAQINRFNRAIQGQFASRLLRHINNLKKDRTKSGADFIIQSARGYIQNDKGWLKKYNPCRVILFEDLARYRFRTDRSRKENRQLMKWNHREIIRESELQAQIYGIVIKTTAAGFTSRFHAASNAPGIRARMLKRSDYENETIKEHINKKLSDYRFGNLEKGMLVPWDGGEEFVTVEPQLITVQADINAAQNLQRRLWTRCGDAYRLACVKVIINGSEFWYPESQGVTLRGGLTQLDGVGPEGYVRLKKNSTYFEVESISRQEWNNALNNAGDEHEHELTEKGELEDILDDLEIEISDEKETFFRDPSGLFFDTNNWVPAKEFWSMVKIRIIKKMKTKPVAQNNDGKYRA